jgi:hypothetical protein
MMMQKIEMVVYGRMQKHHSDDDLEILFNGRYSLTFLEPLSVD